MTFDPSAGSIRNETREKTSIFTLGVAVIPGPEENFHLVLSFPLSWL